MNTCVGEITVLWDVTTCSLVTVVCIFKFNAGGTRILSYQNPRRHISKDNSFYSHHLEDCKSYLDCDDFLMSRYYVLYPLCVRACVYVCIHFLCYLRSVVTI
jgi:hypothetical protein